MTPERLVLVAVIVAVAGAALTLSVARSRSLAGWLALAITVATAGLVLTAAWRVLAHGPSDQTKALWALPGLGIALRIHVDGLTAVFLALSAVIAVPAALYSVGYMRRYGDDGVGRYYPNLLLFLAAMYGLVSTTDMMWFFFIFWQMMTIPGYLLIRYESREAANRRAAMRFMVMMQIACVVTMVGAEILAMTGARVSGDPSLKYDFPTVSANLPAMLAGQPTITAFAFLLFLVGFGIKMGMWPFGAFWLPDAHPAAPSPVSAMLSGVMIKTGIYGLLRYFLWLVPEKAMLEYPLAGWGSVIALLGTITLVTGTAAALRQEYAKRLLAFHSIGQVGYILLASGTCMVLLAHEDEMSRSMAALAACGALMHVVNHGVFKALLFLNAGSMLHATGTQDLNRMGGLWAYMPFTALTALVASLSISGLPMFNGFVSKWAIYVPAIRGSEAAPFLAGCAVMAFLTSALTLASFVKFFGAGFLVRRSATVMKAAERGRLEVGWTMLGPQLALAAICIVTGVVPALLSGFAQRALFMSRSGIAGRLADAAPLGASPTGGIAAGQAAAGFAPIIVGFAFALALLISWGVSRLGSAQRRKDAPWLCGYATEAESNRYTAHGFYSELKHEARGKG